MRGVFADSSPFFPPGAPPQTPRPTTVDWSGEHVGTDSIKQLHPDDTTCISLVSKKKMLSILFGGWVGVGERGGGGSLAMLLVTVAASQMTAGGGWGDAGGIC